MNIEQIIKMARDAGSIDSEEVILTVHAAIRAATKEEDAKICEKEEDAHMVFHNWQAAKALDVAAAAIRASK